MIVFNMEIALLAFISSRHFSSPLANGRKMTWDIHLCVVDHYEPQVGKPRRETAKRRVEDWLERYPKIASKHRDCLGQPPKHSFFYPYDEYDEWEFSRIAELCRDGWGELEIHLHHWNDTSDGVREKLREAKRLWADKGMLAKWRDGSPAFGFIHGNWALDNGRWRESPNPCGVNDEISILLEEGCYADFTFPAWRSPAQPRMMNAIYYAKDDPEKPKSYDRGDAARANSGGEYTEFITTEYTENTEIMNKGGGDGIPEHARGGRLLMVPGVLATYIERKGGKIRIAMDDSDLASYRRYHPARLDRWVRAGIHVQGAPNHIFIKIHCHGAADANREALLGEDLDALFTDAEARYNDGERYRLHYVTAREMANRIYSLAG